MNADQASVSLPPTWLLGLSTFCSGAFTGVLLLTIPQLLAAQGSPQPQIAQVTSLTLLPGCFAFLLAPILDVRFSRKAYAIVLGVLQAVLLALALNLIGNLAALTVCMVVLNTATNLFPSAVAGWFGPMVPRDHESRLGAWFAAGNFGGFGLMSSVAILLLRGLPYQLGIAAVILVALLPLLLLFPFVPARQPDRALAHPGFGKVLRELSKIFNNRHLLRMTALFAMPAATFALTNTLGGLGREFHAAEGFVGLVGGLGATLGGIFGALVAPSLARRMPPIALYIAIGVCGALFTLCLLVPARTPALFAVAMVGENVFQSAAFAVVNALALLSIGKSNPFAATQFAFVNATITVPLAYMQFIAGQAFAWNGLTGTLFVDASVSIVACLSMALLFATRWRDSLTPQA